MSDQKSPHSYHGDPFLLTWREGDDITDKNLQAIVDHNGNTFGQTHDWHTQTLSRLNAMSNLEESAELACFIASVMAMSLEDFTRSFPTVVANSDAECVNALFSTMSQMSALKTGQDNSGL